MIKLFGRKRNEPEQAINMPPETASEPKAVDVQPENVKVDIHNRESRIGYLEKLAADIGEAKKQCEDIKFEYGQVTSNLKDIQLIDQADEESRKVITEVADGIYELTKEREKLSKQKYHITPDQRQVMDSRQNEILKDLDNLKEHEDYQLKIKNDLHQLTGEKNMLMDEKEEIIGRQRMLKKLAKVFAVALVILTLAVLALNQYYVIDLPLSLLLVAGFVLLVAGFISYEAYRNRYDMVMTEKLCNRAIFLTNRVKIKYVNTTNAIQYICARYHVKNGVELDYVYTQYRKMMVELSKKQEGTKLLNEYNTVLVHSLRRLGVKDCDIWFYQARALCDPKEMVEVRHDLNVRRQQLRDRMDYNAGVLEKSINELEKIRSVSKEYKNDVELVLKDTIM